MTTSICELKDREQYFGEEYNRIHPDDSIVVAVAKLQAQDQWIKDQEIRSLVNKFNQKGTLQ